MSLQKDPVPHGLVGFLTGKSHPLRSALVDEMHVRRFPELSAPMRLTQLVMLTGEQSPEAARRAAVELCRLHGAAPPAGRYFSVRIGPLHFVWEQHTEVCTYTFIKTGAFSDPFDQPVLLELPHRWVDALPGKVLRATQVALLGRESAEPAAGQLERYFDATELMTCEVQGREARIWSDFLLYPDGLGRLLIRDQSLNSMGDTARLVQRLQELGNYRNMALLGLPDAQSQTPLLSALEQRLSALTHEIAAGADGESRLLGDLSDLSAELARITAATRYRMSATRAYAQLVDDRLRELDVRRVAGYQSLADFTERRLTPAVRTCESFSQRLDSLSQGASWVSSLMQARIETKLTRQNTELLQSMNRRARMQLRLQQTIEGLSVFAVTYYLVGILGYVAEGLVPRFGWLDVTAFKGIAAPIVLALTWYMVRRMRRSANQRPDAGSAASGG
jgi:uncharacterized membrane-anchored protein